MPDWLNSVLIILSVIVIWGGAGTALGIAAQYTMESKGYYKKIYFWWGFFGGLIGLLIAKSRPDARYARDENSKDYFFEDSGYYDDDKRNRRY